MSISKKALLITGVVIVPLAIWTISSGKLQQSPTPVTPTPSASPAVVADITVEKLLQTVNVERAKANLPALNENPGLDASAAEKCADIATFNYWAHDNPNGTEWESFIDKHVNYVAAAENLASNYKTVNQVVTSWMNSPEHKANIIDARYTDVGYGVCTDESLGTVVVQHFADLP